jgi:hypothetical protein
LIRNDYRVSAFFAAIFNGLGIVLLAFNFIEGLTFKRAWPLFFFIFAISFYMPALLWRGERHGLAGLYIPGSIFLTLGLVFTYNTFSGDWNSWWFAWTWIPAGVGLGLFLGARAGGWGSEAAAVGAWMLGVNVALFAVLATFFGAPLLKTAGPAMIIICGLVVILNALLRPRHEQ